ncbi:MAG: rhodanese-like domain-containing protein [Saprospiraceae bacterium]|nr:rhodanese-like domain-containing protein [Saprospiraceae bacterium]
MTFNKHFSLISCLLVLGSLIISCKPSSSAETQEVNTPRPSFGNLDDRFLDKEIFAAEMKKSSAVILDVRMPGEFDQGHIEGAVNINFFDPEFKHKLLDLNKNSKYYIYCKNETRSKMSMKFMLDNDFKDVFVLKNGYEEWNVAKTK